MSLRGHPCGLNVHFGLRVLRLPGRAWRGRRRIRPKPEPLPLGPHEEAAFRHDRIAGLHAGQDFDVFADRLAQDGPLVR